MAELIVILLEMLFYLIIISVAAELTVLGAEILEHKFGAGFVGAVVLGFITTLPELIFVIVAVLAMQPGIALGSAIGGNILLFTLGYGLVILIAYWKHREIVTLPRTIHDDLWYLLIASFYLILATIFDGMLDLFDGIVLLVIYIVYIIHQIIEARNLTMNKLKEELEFETVEHIPRKEYYRSAGLLLFGGILLILAAEPFVHAITSLSGEIGISALFLALVISPLASEMPEKISAFILTMKSMKGAEMAVSNFIGSKVQNNSLLFGLMTIVSIVAFGTGIETGGEIVALLLMVFTTVVGVLVTYDLQLKHKEGILVVGLYVVVIGLLFIIS